MKESRELLREHRHFFIYVVLMTFVPYLLVILIAFSGIVRPNPSILKSAYLAYIWPFAVLIIALILSAHRRLALFVVAAAVLLSTLGQGVVSFNVYEETRFGNQLRAADLVLVNTTARGYVGSIAYYLEDDQAVILYNDDSWQQAFALAETTAVDTIILSEFVKGPKSRELELPPTYTVQETAKLAPLLAQFFTLSFEDRQ